MKAIQKQRRSVKTVLAQVFGAMFGTTDSAAWTDWVGNSQVEGVSVTPQTAMQLDAVWACVRLISETIATLPLSLFERTTAGKRVADQHPLHTILHAQANADSTSSVFLEAMVASMLLRGYGRAEKLYAGTRLAGLAFLDPDRLTRNLNGAGKKEWRYTELNGTQRVIPDNRVWNVPGFTLDGINGVSVIKYGALVFGGAIAAERAALRTFSNGMLQTVFYKVANFLKPAQRQEFRDNVLGTVERGQTPLLEGGTDVSSIGVNPADSQLLESRGFSVQAICRWFRVPPHMIGFTDKTTSWGTGIEQQMIGFLTFTLAPWLKRLEQAIAKDLLTPAERSRYYAKFNVEGLLRADSAGRAAFYTAMVNNGILTRDEVRELEERSPLGGNAAVLTVQSAMTTLDSLGSQPADQQARAALRALLGFDELPTSG